MDHSAPINQFDSDYFSYAPVAQDVVQFLTRSSTPSPLTIGIEGPYGSGKTSLINLIKSELRDVVVIDFSPWHSASKPFHEQLLEQLAFSALPTSPALASALRYYADQLSSTSIGKGALAAIRGSNNLSILEANDPKGVVNELIVASGVSYLVVVDDIDRLLPDEITALLRLMRNTADFSNVRYLIAYDRSILSASLGDVHDPQGKFMDKIVQVEAQLPHIPGVLLADRCISMTFEMLPDLLDPVAIGHLRARARDTLGNLLETPRDAIRTAYSVTFSYGRLGRNIDFHDALILGALRLRYPKFVRSMAEMRERIFEVPQNQHRRNKWYSLRSVINGSKTELEGILDLEAEGWGIPVNKKALVLGTMQHLFQNNSFASDDYFYSVRNVSSFYRYFGFSLPKDAITEEEYVELLSAEGSRQIDMVHKVFKDGLVFSLCQRLENDREAADERIVELYFLLGRTEIKSEKDWSNQVAAFFFWVRERMWYSRSSARNGIEGVESFRSYVIRLMTTGEYPYDYERRVCEGVLSELNDSFVLSKDYCEQAIVSYIEKIIDQEPQWNEQIEDALSSCSYRGWVEIGDGRYQEKTVALRRAAEILEMARVKFGNRPYTKWFVRNNSPFPDQPTLYAVADRARAVYGDWDKFESRLTDLEPDDSVRELLDLFWRFKEVNFQQFVKYDLNHLK